MVHLCANQPQLVSRFLKESGLKQLLMNTHYYPPQGNPTGEDSSFLYLRTGTSHRFMDDDVRKWQPRDMDVVALTFPKSGTHLLTQMLLQTIGDGNVTFANVHHAGAFWIEWEVAAKNQCNDPDILSIANFREKRPSEPVVFGSHLPAPMLVRPGGHKYVVLCRNPFDVAVSQRNQFVQVGMPAWLLPTPEDMLDIQRVMLYGIVTYYLQWWKEQEKNPDKVLFLFYEDVVANMTSALTKVSVFLGKELSTEALERAAHRCSIEYMKSISERFEPPLSCGSFWLNLNYSKSHMVNKGSAGHGKRLAQDAQEKHKAYFRDVMAGSTFPLERYFGAH